jgi:hypothetical protein|tara:strand:+ start:349 stop:522 length:174 start_codon:yes stop_codon:yes gene_type:complete
MNIEQKIFEQKQQESRSLIGEFLRQEILRLTGGNDYKALPPITFDQLFNTTKGQENE